jgi:hypothetical protein
MTGKPNTTRHYLVLDAIKAYMNDHGFPPTMRDLMKKTGIASTSVVSYYLRLLEGEGLIRREAKISRGIEIVGMGTLAWSHKGMIRPASSLTIKKIDQRKTSSAETNAKKAIAGRMGKGGSALLAKKSQKDPGLQLRIDLVVARALGRAAGSETAAGNDVSLIDNAMGHMANAMSAGTLREKK